MRIIDLFSDIEGFSLGFQRANYSFTEHYSSEIDKHTIANYKYNFPNTKHIGDVTTTQPTNLAGANIITFGSSCVDFLVAGRRIGLIGARSSLIQYAIAFITCVRLSVFIWENVKSAFSSNARADFWAILQTFTNIGGYRLEWQLLNTSWVLPQNRERIYLVEHLARRSETGAFPIREDDFFTTEKAQVQSQTLICATLRASGSVRPEDTCIIPKEANTLTGGGKSGGLHSDIITVGGVRRLTEIKYKRLQGFPDNYTQYGNYGGRMRRISETNRCKLVDNVATVDIVELIVGRLKFTKQ